MSTALSVVPYRQVRAYYNDTTITVYQAYKESIAKAAVDAQKLNASPDFKPGRMTWIKPSWTWMMYRAGYSYKDPGQSRILALRMKHKHFITLLELGVLSSHSHKLSPGIKREKTVDVRIQWDPERTAKLEVLPYRSIQIGIPGALSEQWANEWIVEIEDVTDKARELKRVIDERPEITDEELLGMDLIYKERPFEVPEAVHTKLEMTDIPV
ncbi:atp-dependent rna helicase dhx8 [Fusarium subglutinans]|uniref:Atp-dependent rna helicase dhx8 n=1 Tax=Gibberella subglutinans TaxID=42677 RepID=A0A8H5V097_GIBSU|nr:atp-dependent rna helicase dhx8 [Fusarium subglutinans]KAF5603694.1 atp-dependent rna helicase dhx8 [Fusarium subglutinans]